MKVHWSILTFDLPDLHSHAPITCNATRKPGQIDHGEFSCCVLRSTRKNTHLWLSKLKNKDSSKNFILLPFHRYNFCYILTSANDFNIVYKNKAIDFPTFPMRLPGHLGLLNSVIKNKIKKKIISDRPTLIFFSM